MNQNLFFQKAAVRKGAKVVAIGDGRHDSPGFTACYCTYIVMVRKQNEGMSKSLIIYQDSKTSKIIGFYIVHKDQVFRLYVHDLIVSV